MSRRRIYDDERHAQFVTFSCYKRRKLLTSDRAKAIVLGCLSMELSRRDGCCIGFVIMPDHVHALVWFDETQQLSGLMNKWKERSSARIKELFRRSFPSYWSTIVGDDAVWQPRYYPFNVFTNEKIEEKLDYMHMNPVRALLLADPCDWGWSSARWYLQGKPVGIPIRMPPL